MHLFVSSFVFLFWLILLCFEGLGGVSVWCFFFRFCYFFFVWLWIPLHFKILIVLINSWMSYKEPGNNCNCSFFLLFFNLISDYVIYNFMYTFKWQKTRKLYIWILSYFHFILLHGWWFCENNLDLCNFSCH